MAERSMAEVFSRVYETNKWRGKTGSGPGSVVSRTALIRERLPSLVDEYSIRTLLDAPCGDFNWMKEVDLPVEKYVGVDVVEAVIEQDRREHAGADRSFEVRDLTRDPLPHADLVLCRDCLPHFTEDETMRAVNNVRASAARYLLTTTFFSLDQNAPGATGGWRPINLERPPFSFPAPLELVQETTFDVEVPYSDKSLGLWRVEDLPERLSGVTP